MASRTKVSSHSTQVGMSKSEVSDAHLAIEINKLAGDVGAPSGMDGVIDKEADQYIGGAASTGGDSGFANTVEDGMVNQGSF